MSSWISGTNWWSHSGDESAGDIRPTVDAFGGKILGFPAGAPVDDMVMLRRVSAATALGVAAVVVDSGPNPAVVRRLRRKRGKWSKQIVVDRGQRPHNPATPTQVDQ